MSGLPVGDGHQNNMLFCGRKLQNNILHCGPKLQNDMLMGGLTCYLVGPETTKFGGPNLSFCGAKDDKITRYFGEPKMLFCGPGDDKTTCYFVAAETPVGGPPSLANCIK